MKKLSVVLLSVILFISMTMPIYASVPEKNGYIQDSAQIFPEDKLKEINLITHLENSNITFYILTVDNLNGKSSAEYASEAFQAWELKENDVLMLISHEDRRIEVNYKNKNFLSNVNLPIDYDQDGDSRESILEEVIGKDFIPFAKKEDYASGVISFMNTFRSLHTVKENSNHAETESKPLNTDENNKEDSETSTSNNAKARNAIFIVFAIAAAIIPLIYLINIIINSRDVERPRIRLRTDNLPNTNSQRQQPITVADALENMLNNNNTTVSQPTESNSDSNNTDNTQESLNTNPGYRVIRSTKEVKNDNEKQDKYQNKRVIR